MMMRYGLGCRGCGGVFVARMGAQSTNGTRFYLPCPHCTIPIRGQARGQGPEDYVVAFDCDRISIEEIPAGTVVVTTNPFVPSKYDADGLQHFGGSGMFALMALLDDDVEAYFSDEGSAQQVIVEMWPHVVRLYEYYLGENWAAFDKTGSSVFEDWEPVRTAHERTTAANHALGLVCLYIVGQPNEAADRFLSRFTRKHTAALESPAYIQLLRDQGSSGDITRLQRAVFETIELFVSQFEKWGMGRLARHVGEPQQAHLDGLVLFRDEFGETRDLYQRGFEVVCKTLRYVVAAQNTVKRRDPNDFGVDHPASVPQKTRPTSLARYDRMANAHRLAYVAQVPGWEGYAGLLDNKIRNTIGHASARHDLRLGRIVADRDPEGVTYLTFISRVFDVFEALGMALQVLRFARVASSQGVNR
jgi:hypothetical protein